MEPALIRNQNCVSDGLPNPLPAAAGRRHLPLTSARLGVAHPVFGADTVGLTTDLSATGRALSSISCCGSDRHPVHPTLQRLRGCSFTSEHPALLRQSDIEPTMLAWKNGEEATRTTTLAALPFAQLRFASNRRAEHQLLSSQPAAARVAQNGHEAATAHGVISLARTWGLDGPRRPSRH